MYLSLASLLACVLESNSKPFSICNQFWRLRFAWLTWFLPKPIWAWRRKSVLCLISPLGWDFNFQNWILTEIRNETRQGYVSELLFFYSSLLKYMKSICIFFFDWDLYVQVKFFYEKCFWCEYWELPAGCLWNKEIVDRISFENARAILARYFFVCV